jgi:flavodoxin
MKIAIVYYSYEGNCALAAETLAEIFTASGKTAAVFEIKTEDTKKRRGFSKYFWGGSQVFMRKKPALAPLDFDPAGHDLIILGTPIWAASPAPAMRSFLDKTPLEGRRAALFCCHAGGKGSAMEQFRSLLPDCTIAGEIDLPHAKSRPEALREKLRAWAAEITNW